MITAQYAVYYDKNIKMAADVGLDFYADNDSFLIKKGDEVLRRYTELGSANAFIEGYAAAMLGSDPRSQ